MQFLRFLAVHRTPALNFMMEVFTQFGAELLFMVIAISVFWCVNKRQGYYLLFVGFLGTIFNQFLKLAFRISRPWVRDPSFQPVKSAVPGATGYSFPSGHTQNVVGTLGGIARDTKRRWLQIVCVAVACLTAFSRMYLGVHTPMDVGVSFAIATVLVFVMYPIVGWAVEQDRRMYLLMGIMSVLAIAYVLYSNLWHFPASIEADNLYEGRKNSFSLLGALLGMLAAYPVERKYVRFETQAVWWAQILKVTLGLLLLLAVRSGLKALLLCFLTEQSIWYLVLGAVRYGLMVFIAAAVYPRSFRYFAGLGKGRDRA